MSVSSQVDPIRRGQRSRLGPATGEASVGESAPPALRAVRAPESGTPPEASDVPSSDDAPIARRPGAPAETQAPAVPASPSAETEEASAPEEATAPEEDASRPSKLPVLTGDLDTPPSEAAAPPVRATATPILASEALMEDLAPVEPARREARAWCAAFGAGFVIFGLLALARVRPGGFDGAVPWLVSGLLALVASITRVGYRQRAMAMVVIGLLSGVIALEANGAALLSADGGRFWGASRLLAAVGLAAALLFRARYRAYSGARVFLGVAIALSIPFVAHTVIRFALAGIGLGQVGAIAALIMLVVSLTGFMGSETTGAGPYMAPITVIAFAADVALRAVFKGTPTPPFLIAAITAAVGFAGAATLAAFGVFQILAWRFAADARRIDLHAPRRHDHRSDPRGPDWFG